MATLVKNDYVEKKSNPAKYFLTEEGRQMAVRIFNNENVDTQGKVVYYLKYA